MMNLVGHVVRTQGMKSVLTYQGHKQQKFAFQHNTLVSHNTALRVSVRTNHIQTLIRKM